MTQTSSLEAPSSRNTIVKMWTTKVVVQTALRAVDRLGDTFVSNPVYSHVIEELFISA